MEFVGKVYAVRIVHRQGRSGIDPHFRAVVAVELYVCATNRANAVRTCLFGGERVKSRRVFRKRNRVVAVVDLVGNAVVAFARCRGFQVVEKDVLFPCQIGLRFVHGIPVFVLKAYYVFGRHERSFSLSAIVQTQRASQRAVGVINGELCAYVPQSNVGRRKHLKGVLYRRCGDGAVGRG